MFLLLTCIFHCRLLAYRYQLLVYYSPQLAYYYWFIICSICWEQGSTFKFFMLQESWDLICQVIVVPLVFGRLNSIGDNLVLIYRSLLCFIDWVCWVALIILYFCKSESSFAFSTYYFALLFDKTFHKAFEALDQPFSRQNNLMMWPIFLMCLFDCENLLSFRWLIDFHSCSILFLAVSFPSPITEPFIFHFITESGLIEFRQWYPPVQKFMAVRDIGSGFGLDLTALLFAPVFRLAFVQLSSIANFRLISIHRF